MIGYWMLYAAAAGLPVLLAALVASAVLRKHGKSERGVWLAGLGLALAMPVVAVLDPFSGTSAASEVPTGVIPLPEFVVVPEPSSAIGLNEVLLSLWLLASAALLFRWTVAAVRLSRRSGSWRRETVDGVSVWLTESLGPAVSGVFTPRILVPSWLASLPARQRSLVLLHEEEHVRARDPLIMAAARLARIVAPWNPVVWMLSSKLLDAIELDCDRRVLSRRPEIDVYGATLLDIAARGSEPLVAAAAFAEPTGPLHKRIIAMTTPRRTVSVLGMLSAGVLGTVLLLGACEVPVPVRVSIDVTVERADDEGAATEDVVVREIGASEAEELELVLEEADRAAEGRPEAPPAPTAEPTDERGLTEPVAPPPAPDAIRRLRRESPVPRESAPREPQPRERSSTPDTDGSAGDGPSFTPFTVAPSITNRDEVVAAMQAEFPPLLRDAGIGGTVRVYFYIDETGRVQQVRVDKSSGHPALDDAALAVANVYRFTPALNDGEPVPVWVSFPITFQVR